MNAMNVSPVKPPISSESHIVPTIPSSTKPPLPQNVLISQTNHHNSFPRIPLATPPNDLTQTSNSDKPLNLYVSSVQKNATNFVATSSEATHLETLKPVALPATNTVPSSTVATSNSVIKHEDIVQETNSSNTTTSVLLTKPEPATQNTTPITTEVKDEKPSPAITDLPKVTEKVEPISDVEAKPKEIELKPEKEVKPVKEKKEKESSSQKNENLTNLNVKQPPQTEPAVESQPVKKRKLESKEPIEVNEEKNATTNDHSKPKRSRLPTQIYQSPIPELQLIAKLNTTPKPQKPADEKLTLFYKNEFLAVRNPEGSFYICQTFQNIHRKSTKIKIRWFTDLPDNVFSPDFCDTTEFDCIITNVSLVRLEKNKWKLPEGEKTRVDNILKRALDVESGAAEKPSVTEEHPDGLDLSLYKDEAQLNKRKRRSPVSKKKNDGTAAKRKKSSVQSGSSTSAGSSASRKVISAQSSYLNQGAIKSSGSGDGKSKTTAATTSSSKKAQKGAKPKKKLRKPHSNKTVNSASGNSSSSVGKVTNDAAKSSASSSKSAKKSSIKNVAKIQKSSTTVSTTSTAASNSVATSYLANSSSAASKRNKTDSILVPAANSEKPTKSRNAGAVVGAKINSAARLNSGSKERNSSGGNQRKK